MTKEELAKMYPLLNIPKMNRRLTNLSRMARFYNSKIEEAPPKQAELFNNFVVSLIYAESIIKSYQKLVEELQCMD